MLSFRTTLWRAIFVAFALSGSLCAAQEKGKDKVMDMTASHTLQAVEPTDEFEGFDGWWLRNDAAEAFVCATPFPRVLVYRLIGMESPLLVDRNFTAIGIRGRFHEEGKDADSMAPTETPAKAFSLGDGRGLLLEAEPEEEKTHLAMTMEVRLHDTAPLLTIRHAFRDLSGEERRIAPWCILAVQPRGVGVLPYRQEDFAKRIVHFRGLTVEQEGVNYGKNALAVDYGVKPVDTWFKTGTDSNLDWFAYTAAGQTFISRANHVDGAEYPESGATVTIFKWPGGAWRAEPFGEIEHNGAFTQVEPHGTVEMIQTVEILPAVRPDGDDADAWYQAVLEAVAPPEEEKD